MAERKANPIDKNDLLNKMLLGRDAKTGEGLSDKAITNNVSRVLSAVLKYLNQHPYFVVDLPHRW